MSVTPKLAMGKREDTPGNLSVLLIKAMICAHCKPEYCAEVKEKRELHSVEEGRQQKNTQSLEKPNHLLGIGAL